SGSPWALAIEPTNLQFVNTNDGLFGHAPQLAVPTNRHSLKIAPSLLPSSARSPTPLLLENSQDSNLRSRTVFSPSASISTPAPGALIKPPFPVWRNREFRNV